MTTRIWNQYFKTYANSCIKDKANSKDSFKMFRNKIESNRCNWELWSVIFYLFVVLNRIVNLLKRIYVTFSSSFSFLFLSLFIYFLFLFFLYIIIHKNIKAFLFKPITRRSRLRYVRYTNLCTCVYCRNMHAENTYECIIQGRILLCLSFRENFSPAKQW